MTSYLWHKLWISGLDEKDFVESEHPRDEDGKFSAKGKESSQPVSKEKHLEGVKKINACADYLKSKGIKFKDPKATTYGSLYIKAYLPLKNGVKYWADITFRGKDDHSSKSNFDLVLSENATIQDFIKGVERVEKVFAQSKTIQEAHDILRQDQYKKSTNINNVGV